MKKEMIAKVVDGIDVLVHSSIRIAAGKTLYFDPYKVEGEAHDADVIFLTHEHYDHFSPEDMAKLMKEDTVIVVPKSMAGKAGTLRRPQLVTVSPSEKTTVCGFEVEVVPAYNVDKKFHPKSEKWVGYVVTVDGVRVYVTGDTDASGDNEKVKCDVLLVPIGGTYTFTAPEAADFVNVVKPAVAIPTHYGCIVGTPEDAEDFRARVDDSVEVVLKCGRFA